MTYTGVQIRKTVAAIWALAVLWLYVGNLVNFHLHHIWGKQLLPVACSGSRSKEKDAAAFSTKSFVKHFYPGNDQCQSVPVAQSSLSVFITAYVMGSFQSSSFPCSGNVSLWLLRGPPAA